MTGPATGALGLAAVIRIDLRAAAAGSDAVDAQTFGADTLIDTQRHAVEGHYTGPAEQGSHQRFIDVGRVLVIDDAATFARHAPAYQHLVVAPTIGKLLCLTVGAPADPTAIDLPKAATSRNAAVLWVGDPRGVAWHLGLTTTTKLAEGGADPDGSGTLAELADTLAEPPVFDRVFGAISELDGHVAAAALLPAVRWPALDLMRLAEEQVAGGGPAGIVEVLDPDLRQLLIDLWSYAPAVARCERLLTEAEEATRRLPRVPGIGGRRAWRAVTEAGQACAELGPAGSPWADVRFPGTMATKLREPEQAASMWHPAALLPLLALGCGLVALVPPWGVALAAWAVVLAAAALLSAALPGLGHSLPSRRAAALVAAATTVGATAGAAAAATAHALNHLGIPPVAADAASAAVGAAVLIATAFTWWHRATRRWIDGLPLDEARTVLKGIPLAIANRGVMVLSEAADSWYRAQQRRLVTWWFSARRTMRVRILGEVAELFKLPKPAGPPPPETTEAAAEDGAAVAATEDLAATVQAITGSAAQLLASTAADEDFRQLTAPEQLPLLDGTPQTARLVVFAPAAAQEALTDAVAEGVLTNDVAWTATGENVGVIRLVPVRPGLLRSNGVGAASAETVIAIDVSGGGGHAAGALTEWLRTDDELDGRVTPPGSDGGPIIVQLPNTAVARTLAKEITDWLRRSDDTTEVTFTGTDGRIAIVNATEVKIASEREVDAIVTRTVSSLNLP